MEGLPDLRTTKGVLQTTLYPLSVRLECLAAIIALRPIAVALIDAGRFGTGLHTTEFHGQEAPRARMFLDRGTSGIDKGLGR